MSDATARATTQRIDQWLWVARFFRTRSSAAEAVSGGKVHVDGEPLRSCRLQIRRLGDREVTTIEALSEDRSHALQRAWLAEQVPQCAWCMNGQMMTAAALAATMAIVNRRRVRPKKEKGMIKNKRRGTVIIRMMMTTTT